jgi:hypothetical protein
MIVHAFPAPFADRIQCLYGIGRIPNVVRSPNPFSLCHASLDPIFPLRRDRVSALSAERSRFSRGVSRPHQTPSAASAG